MYLNCPRLENTSSINRIKSVLYQISVITNVREFLSCFFDLRQVLFPLILHLTELLTVSHLSLFGLTLPLGFLVFSFLNVLLNFLLLVFNIFTDFEVTVNLMKELFGSFLITDLQLLGSYILVSMPDLLLFEHLLFDLLSFLLLLAFVINNCLNNLLNALSIRVVGMASWRFDNWWYLWGLVLATNFFTLSPCVLNRIVKQWLFLDTVIELLFRQRCSSGLESLGIKWLSDSISILFNN